MFGKLLNKKRAEAQAALKKFENKDLIEGMVWAMTWAAFADGEAAEAEKTKVDTTIRLDERLADFASEALELKNRSIKIFEENPRQGKLQAKREIKDCITDKQDCEDILMAAFGIIEGDGEVDESEQKFIEELATLLNLNIADYQ
jgi:tellurite resistance protein